MKNKMTIFTLAGWNLSGLVVVESRLEESINMTWHSYGLDREAQKLVLAARQRDEALPKSEQSKACLNQGHKMRMAVSYGLERFWGEHLRLQEKEENKSLYWKATWDALVRMMEQAGLPIPNETVRYSDTTAIQKMSEQLWQLELEKQRVALAILTQLCDCIVWWTQRYKGGAKSNG
jgi:hypothetical protein